MVASVLFGCVNDVLMLCVKWLSGYLHFKSVSPIIYPKPPLHIVEGGFCVFASLFAPLNRDYRLMIDKEIPFKPPYKAARLVNGDKPLTVRWYIMFWAWDGKKKRLVRKRFYEINKFSTAKERIAYAAKEIKAINTSLKEGGMLNPAAPAEKKRSINLKQDFTVKQAFDFVITHVKASKRPATFNTYSSCANLFVQWWVGVYGHQHKITFLHKQHIIEYLDFVQTDRSLNNCTRNQYLSHTRSMLGLMVERGIIEHNPASGVKEEPEDVGGNTAYLPGQISMLKEAISAENYRLWLFVQFIFYGFIRPAEIGRLRVKYISLDTDKIYLPGSITKNRKARHVIISPPFKKYILEMGLENWRPDDYVFGHNLQTGPYPLQKNFAGQTHYDIVKALKLGPGYTLYSWKHTGVIMHYRAGIDIKTLQAQLGHWSLQETDKYMKSLGLFENKEFELKSPII
jgi:integrase